MQTRIIHDNTGVWLVNIAKFTFVDPESGCRFDPHVPTQAKLTEWAISQDAVIKAWSEPELEVKPMEADQSLPEPEVKPMEVAQSLVETANPKKPK